MSGDTHGIINFWFRAIQGELVGKACRNSLRSHRGTSISHIGSFRRMWNNKRRLYRHGNSARLSMRTCTRTRTRLPYIHVQGGSRTRIWLSTCTESLTRDTQNFELSELLHKLTLAVSLFKALVVVQRVTPLTCIRRPASFVVLMALWRTLQ